MASKRTFVAAAWSLQRGDHGEQPTGCFHVSPRGQVGLPGGGFGLATVLRHLLAQNTKDLTGQHFQRAENPTGFAIPVARISDMLLHPGDIHEMVERSPIP